ncbi:EscU/YscU/HrcU family type III secretion system export apparatus switch protein [Clostridium sp. Cult1]|jgi:flagellar biosynthesis protein|uniref:EscU/YscU/HrcU family type III secretion system export apparatus switch protein n=1 Tax=Clostridium sp. Cult1 TaxID=2079002 RepID=UPI001EFF9B3D|nr:EscU/YscU/HrcU family type III secretion system export apparatus switch protein [Clostridium sp. Cult1]MCF6463353.1 flagellar biogenesis protein [Clostridium sp. Cult1]
MKKDMNNKNKKAVALFYKEGFNAPKVIAKGKGEIAEKIIDVGKKQNVEIYEDKDLIDELIKLNLHDEIPPQLYEAVAKIVFFVYQLDKEKGEYDEE